MKPRIKQYSQKIQLMLRYQNIILIRKINNDTILNVPPKMDDNPKIGTRKTPKATIIGPLVDFLNGIILSVIGQINISPDLIPSYTRSTVPIIILTLAGTRVGLNIDLIMNSFFILNSAALDV